MSIYLVWACVVSTFGFFIECGHRLNFLANNMRAPPSSLSSILDEPLPPPPSDALAFLAGIDDNEASDAADSDGGIDVAERAQRSRSATSSR